MTTILIVRDAGDERAICTRCWDEQPCGPIARYLRPTDLPLIDPSADAEVCEVCGENNLVAVTLRDGAVAFPGPRGCICGMVRGALDALTDWVEGGDCRSIGCDPDCPDCPTDDPLPCTRCGAIPDAAGCVCHDTGYAPTYA